MEELKNVPKGTTGAFLAITAGLAGSTSIAMFAGNSGAMVAGHESKIVSVDYAEVQGVNTPLVGPGGQVVSIGGKDYKLADEGDKPQAVTITFESKRTMTLGLLLQGQAKTTILFKGATAPTPATDIKLEDIATKLIGKTLKCTKYYRDSSNLIQRPAVGNAAARAPYPANVYEFIEV